MNRVCRRERAFSGSMLAGLRLVCCLVAAIGCSESDLGYAIWPKAARTGDTIAIVIDSDFTSEAEPEAALLDASIETIEIELRDSSGYSQRIAPRALLELPAARGSGLVGIDRVSWNAVVAIFDVPDPWLNAALVFPDVIEVTVHHRETPTLAGRAHFELLGSGGSPLRLPPVDLGGGELVDVLEEAQLGPMLRLRPVWDSETFEGFDPAWTIGALEFELRHHPPEAGDVAGLRALPAGDAACALALVDALDLASPEKRWRISLVDPLGFSIPSPACATASPCLAGRWSLIDLPVEKVEDGLLCGEEVFTPEDFTIDAVRVFDLEGQQLNLSQQGSKFFAAYAVDNRAVPEPGLALQIAVGTCGLVALDRLRRRGGRSS